MSVNPIQTTDESEFKELQKSFTKKKKRHTKLKP
jgi:hypothetical protein